MFSATSSFDRLIRNHQKTADKARKIIAKLEAEEKAAEEALTQHIAKVTQISKVKERAHKFAAKVEEFI
jgi:hypothetical protein